MTTPSYLLPHVLTDHQRAVIDQITARETPPSTVELARHFGVSRQAMQQTLHALEKRGVLEDAPRVVRSGKWRVKGG